MANRFDCASEQPFVRERLVEDNGQEQVHFINSKRLAYNETAIFSLDGDGGARLAT